METMGCSAKANSLYFGKFIHVHLYNKLSGLKYLDKILGEKVEILLVEFEDKVIDDDPSSSLTMVIYSEREGGVYDSHVSL